jgi:hypothetical protein
VVGLALVGVPLLGVPLLGVPLLGVPLVAGGAAAFAVRVVLELVVVDIGVWASALCEPDWASIAPATTATTVFE